MIAENRKLEFSGELLVEKMATGAEFHLVITKGLSPEEGGQNPRIVAASYDGRRDVVSLEFDRPVPNWLTFMNVPPL